MRIYIIAGMLAGAILFFGVRCTQPENSNAGKQDTTGNVKVITPDFSDQVKRGKYLSTIGVCSACHTPPRSGSRASGMSAADSAATDLLGRTNDDWYAQLDHDRELAGGVPFWLRFGANSRGVVYSKNITQDKETGIGSWTDQDLYTVLKTGKRKDGTALFLFPPHSFFKNLADEDVYALIAWLKTIPPIKNTITPANLPFPTAPDSLVTLAKAPTGRSVERGNYLTSAIVGCAECHSHTDKNGALQRFAGGNDVDPFLGVFKLGPDLPLRQTERGFAAFPYDGYALLYSPNLTMFGKGGPASDVSEKKIVATFRDGIGIQPDPYGRPVLMAHVMMWQYYRSMGDDDAYSIAEYVKSLNYIQNSFKPGLYLYGTDWAQAFEKMFGTPPTAADRQFFGKQ